MSDLMQAETALFKAVQQTLKKQPFQAPVDDARMFYKLARENGFSGMVFAYLDKTQLPKDVYFAFQKDFYLYNAQHEKQMHVVNDLTELFNTHNIKHIFLKGVPLKTLYPEPYMRSMGDIDVLIEGKDLKAAHKHLKANQYKNLFNSAQHDNFEHVNGMMIEVHPKLYKDFNDKYAPLFKDVWAQTAQEKGNRYSFNPEFEVSYLLYHMVKHFYGTGVGLRTVLDIGIYLQAHKEKIDLETLTTMLQEASLYKFFQNMLVLNKRYFDIDVYPNLTKDAPMDETLYKELTTYILASGVHGKGTNFNAFVGRMGSGRLQNKGRLRFILALLFPSYASMKGIYPWLKYLPFLYPVTWGIRLFKLAVLKTRRSFRKFKQLFVKGEEVQKTTDLFEQLGL